MADTLIVMDGGRVQQVGAPMEVYRDPANAFVAGFIGNTNLLAGELRGPRLTLAQGVVDLGPDDRVKCPDGPALLSVRPEDVRLVPGGLPAQVTFIRDLGESVQLVMDAGGVEVTALFAPRDRPGVDVGDTVALGFEPGRRVVLAA